MRSCLVGGAVGLVFLGAYWTTKLPGLGWDDTPELALAVECHGIPHSPGFPLFVLLGRCAKAAGGMQGASAATGVASFCGAAAAGVAAWRVSTRLGPALGCAAGICVGASPMVWHHATQGEVYTLHLLLTTVLMCLPLHTTTRTSFGQGYVFGLAMGNHPSAAAFLPLLLPAARKRQAALAAGIIAALSLFVVLPIRSQHRPPLDWGQVRTLGGFLWMVSLQEFRSDALAGRLVAGETMRGACQTAGNFLLSALPLLVLGLGVIGVPRLLRYRPLALVSMLLLAIGSTMVGGGPDVSGYLLPLCPLIAMAAMAGAGTLGVPRAISAMGVVASVAALGMHSEIRDRSDDRSAELYQQALASQLHGRMLFTDSSTDLFLLLEHGTRNGGRTAVAYTPYLGVGWYRQTVDTALMSMLPTRPDPPFDSIVQASRARGIEPVFTFSDLPAGALKVLVPEGWILRGGAYDSSRDRRALDLWPKAHAGGGQGRRHRAVRAAQGGQLLAAMGNDHGAAGRFVEALATGPDNAEVWRSLATSLAHAGACDPMVRSASAYLRLAPGSMAAAEALAHAITALHVPCPPATDLVARLAGRFPRSARLTETSAQRFLVEGAPTEALRMLDASQAEESAGLLNLRGVALILLGEYEPAFDILRRADAMADERTRERIIANMTICARRMEHGAGAQSARDPRPDADEGVQP